MEISSNQSSDPTEPFDRGAVSSNSTTGKDECYQLLTQVNLLRIRKQMIPAIDLCQSVLLKWPDRADAQALMGDLYFEADRIDDAILRYCRVLELEPASKPNRQKLTEMVRLKRRRLGPLPAITQPVPSMRLDRLGRAIILSLATLMLLTIMITPAIFERRRLQQISVPSDATVDKEINLNPIVLQPTKPTPAPPTPSTPTNQPSNSQIRDPVEQALVNLMSNDKSLLQQGIQVLDAQEDPATDGFTITFLDRPVDAAGSSKTSIFRNALTVAASASDRFGSRAVTQFTLRCLLLQSSNETSLSDAGATVTGTTALSFVGTIQRTAIPSDDTSLVAATTDQLSSYFTDCWWGDNISS